MISKEAEEVSADGLAEAASEVEEVLAGLVVEVLEVEVQVAVGKIFMTK